MTNNETGTGAVAFAVTTSAKEDNAALAATARRWAEELGTRYVPREKGQTLPAMLERYGLAALPIAAETGPRVYTPEGTMFYHPGLGTVRWQRVAVKGEGDNFLRALDVRPGQKVLDATLGLAADALLASHAVGPAGRVTGLEASPLLYFLTSRGVRTYEGKFPELTQDLRRIEVVRAEASAYLKQLPADSYDVVYFDPMFRHPVRRSSAMQPLRPLAWSRPLAPETVAEALRVAPRVVIKERTEEILREYGCRTFTGTRYSGVRFGIRTREDKR